MIHLKKVFLWFVLIYSNSLFAQEIEWQNVIGGNGTDQIYSIIQTFDGGYICGGRSNSNISGDKTENCLGNFDYWVVKLDSNGILQWQNTIGGSGLEWLQSIQQTNDGGFILGGKSDSDISGDKTENSEGGFDYWVVKLNITGNIQWQNTIGGNANDNLAAIHQTVDGGYILGGSSESNFSGDKTENSQGDSDYWVIKLDSAGSIQWQNTIGGDHSDNLYSIQQTDDWGYICGGSAISGISGDKTDFNRGFAADYWVLKLDSSGNIQWQKTIGGGNSDELTSIQRTSDAGYICGGVSASNISGEKTEICLGSADCWVIKLDSVGNIQWQNSFGGSNYEVLWSIDQTNDGGYICGSSSNSNISGDKSENSKGGTDYWIVKLNQSGNLINQNTIGGNLDEYIQSIRQNSDGSYIIGGWSYSYLSGDKSENNAGNNSFPDYWVMRLCSNSYSIVNASACGQYISPSGNILLIAGTYSDTISSSLGCDSIITINLTILPSPVVTITALGAVTFCQGDSVTLTATPGYINYQWYRRNFPIPGATSENYIVKSRGRYKCIAQNASFCTDTSNIIVVHVPCIPIGPNHERNVSSNESENFQIFPNPGTGIFWIQSSPGQLQIFNSFGQMILSKEISEEETEIDISYYSDGIYFATFKTSGTIHSQKIILLH